MKHRDAALYQTDPGSSDALRLGCTCSQSQQAPEFTIDKGCPVHGVGAMARVLGDEP